MIQWSAVTGSDLPITGYSLEVDDGNKGPFKEVYNGRGNT